MQTSTSGRIVVVDDEENIQFLLLRHGVRPLAAMTATAGAIADGALSARVTETNARTEAGRLGNALNTMLGRIEDAFRERAASEERLRTFVANASHELRTPLTSVRGYAELYRTGALSERAALDDAMRRVEREASRMGDLVEDLLLLAKLDEGRPFERRPVRLDELVSDAVRDAQAVEPNRLISFTAEPVEIVGDEATLRQAVGNLLANARAHTPADTHVEVDVCRDGSWAVIEVADHGPGMTAEVADHVFERFFRADPARSRASGGTGLGLAIVASIAQAHNGAVDVDSNPGAGARFRLRLPRHQYGAAPEQSQISARRIVTDVLPRRSTRMRNNVTPSRTTTESRRVPPSAGTILASGFPPASMTW
jgi:two-component system OmpR family sensor kinase